MWGNLRGWIISLVLALAISGVLAWASVPRGISPPTNAPVLAPALRPVNLGVSPTSVVPAGAETCDSADAYRAAIAAYKQNPAPYNNFQPASLARLSEVPAVADIVKGAGCASMSLFKAHPQDLIGYNADATPLDALRTVGELTQTVGLLHKLAKNDDQARAHFEATFQLGRKLFEERVTFSEMATGVGLMRGAARSLADLAADQNDTTRADMARNFMREADTYRDAAIAAYKIVGGIDENFAGPYAGDIFAIAQSPSADRMWRVEAIKHLGHYRFNAQNRGDQLGARKVLPKLASDATADPIVRAAAVAARDLTVEEHHTTH